MRFLGLVVSLAVLSIPASSRAQSYVELYSDGGYEFDIYRYYGYLSDGTSNAYDGCYYLRVAGSYYYNSGGSYTMSLGGRQVDMPEQSMSSLMVRRMIYVPASGRDWVRYADVFRNPGTTDVTVNVRYDCNMGSGTSTVVVASSSGDTTMSADDTWFVTDDGTDGGGTPALGHVIHGDSPLADVSSFTTPYSDDFEWTYDTTVPAGGQIVLLTFGVQTGMRSDAQTTASSLVDLPSEALDGLDSLLADIVNFQVGGAPLINITSPAMAEEREEIVFDAEVTDREGDTATWSWDPDGDGTFGEHTDMTSYTLAAGMTDGPGTVMVGVEASDGTETRERARSSSATRRWRPTRERPSLPTAAPPVVVGAVIRCGATGAAAPSRPATRRRAPRGSWPWWG